MSCMEHKTLCMALFNHFKESKGDKSTNCTNLAQWDIFRDHFTIKTNYLCAVVMNKAGHFESQFTLTLLLIQLVGCLAVSAAQDGHHAA